jgi:hypothetical protein
LASAIVKALQNGVVEPGALRRGDALPVLARAAR